MAKKPLKKPENFTKFPECYNVFSVYVLLNCFCSSCFFIYYSSVVKSSLESFTFGGKSIFISLILLNINLSTNIIDSDEGFSEENGDIFVNLKIFIVSMELR